MPITERTRLCVSCRNILPDRPAAPVCTFCGRAAVPWHEDWPPFLKWFVIREAGRARFHPWRSEQESWEDLLRDVVNGVHVGAADPNPHRLFLDIPAAQAYPRVLVLATAWKASGSPILPAVDPLARRTPV